MGMGVSHFQEVSKLTLPVSAAAPARTTIIIHPRIENVMF